MKCVRLFLDRGADPAYRNRQQVTTHRCLRLLLDAGADIFIAANIYGSPLAQIKKDYTYKPFYPLVKPIEEKIKKDPVKRFFATCEGGDRETVKGMIDSGFSVNSKNRFGLPPPVLCRDER